MDVVSHSNMARTSFSSCLWQPCSENRLLPDSPNNRTALPLSTSTQSPQGPLLGCSGDVHLAHHCAGPHTLQNTPNKEHSGEGVDSLVRALENTQELKSSSTGDSPSPYPRDCSKFKIHYSLDFN